MFKQNCLWMFKKYILYFVVMVVKLIKIEWFFNSKVRSLTKGGIVWLKN